jgi:hypothetical protein
MILEIKSFAKTEKRTEKKFLLGTKLEWKLLPLKCTKLKKLCSSGLPRTFKKFQLANPLLRQAKLFPETINVNDHSTLEDAGPR